jgi:putative ABC transport system permease protein
MDLVAIIRIAMRALARNKLRSILTMLGIIIGVGAVIAMVSVGQGAQQQAQQQIAAMGSNMLFVQSGTVNRGGMRMGWGATKTLVYDDLLAIMRRHRVRVNASFTRQSGYSPGGVRERQLVHHD